MAMRRNAKSNSKGLQSGRMDSRFDTLESHFASMSARFSTVDFRISELQAEMRSGFAKMETRFDRMMTVLDTVVGKQHDNDQSHVQFGSMLGDHRRTLASHDVRLTSLESRLPPRTP